MINPTYVSFEQAKKLKQKEFDVNVESCNYGHSENENWIYKVHPEFPGWKGRIREAYFENKQPLLIPEQWQVVEWFRLKYGIDIFTPKVKGKYFYDIWRDINKVGFYNERIIFSRKGFNSPQEAYSVAFDHILNNLI